MRTRWGHALDTERTQRHNEDRIRTQPGHHNAFAPSHAPRASSRQTGPVAQGAPKIKVQIKGRCRNVKGEKNPLRGKLNPIKGSFKPNKGEKKPSYD